MPNFNYKNKANIINKPLRIGFLASHNGTDMRGIILAIENGKLLGETKLVISNNYKSSALLFAKEKGIPNAVINKSLYGTLENVDKAIRDLLIFNKVNLVILSGYMKKIGALTIEAYSNHILNVHPSLLPRYAKLWGDNVHQAVLNSKDKLTGLTIHIVDDQYDTGKILLQSKVPVKLNDSIEKLRERVQKKEIQSFIRILKAAQSGYLKL